MHILTCRLPAVRTALHVLTLLISPSVALHVVETTFERGFESFPLRHAVWNAEKPGHNTREIAGNRRNPVALALEPDRRKCRSLSRRQPLSPFFSGECVSSPVSKPTRRMRSDHKPMNRRNRLDFGSRSQRRSDSFKPQTVRKPYRAPKEVSSCCCTAT
jgi:hypothetical protein